jgi:hypothetical protein
LRFWNPPCSHKFLLSFTWNDQILIGPFLLSANIKLAILMQLQSYISHIIDVRWWLLNPLKSVLTTFINGQQCEQFAKQVQWKLYNLYQKLMSRHLTLSLQAGCLLCLSVHLSYIFGIHTPTRRFRKSLQLQDLFSKTGDKKNQNQRLKKALSFCSSLPVTWQYAKRKSLPLEIVF